MKNEKKELARVEKRLREVIEARLERGDALVRMSYGFYAWQEPFVKLDNNGCYACVLGSAVVEELLEGRKVARPAGSIFLTDHRTIAAGVLQIDVARAYALEKGFMHVDYFLDGEHSRWHALGAQLSRDYYETDWV